jgi:hypothetical protein
MSRSIHTTKKDLERERKFAARDDVASTAEMTKLEREDIKKRVHKVNTKRMRQAQSQDAPTHAHLALGESSLVRSARRRRQK